MARGLLDRFLTVFGDLKVFRWPMFIVYDPGSYQVKGHDMREVMRVVRPGDVLVRGYHRYLDGYFIPGYFSHVGLYLGPVEEADRQHVVTPRVEPGEDGTEHFQAGEQMVVHAIAEGVLMEDLLNFCRCDYLAILRPPEQLERTWQGAPAGFPLERMTGGERLLYDRLEKGGRLAFEDAWPELFQVALSMVGRGYDFRFDFTDFEYVSCSELVFYATKALSPHLGVFPTVQRVLGLKRNLLAPDAFLRSPLEPVWQSPSVSSERLALARGAPPPLLAVG